MKRQKDIGKAVSVGISSYEALRTGRMKVIHRPDDEWNRMKFCSRPVKWLYVCRTNDVTGECLRISVASITRAEPSAATSQRPVILIRLGEIAETLNRQTGERTLHFPPRGDVPKPPRNAPPTSSRASQPRPPTKRKERK